MQSIDKYNCVLSNSNIDFNVLAISPETVSLVILCGSSKLPVVTFNKRTALFQKMSNHTPPMECHLNSPSPPPQLYPSYNLHVPSLQ